MRTEKRTPQTLVARTKPALLRQLRMAVWMIPFLPLLAWWLWGEVFSSKLVFGLFLLALAGGPYLVGNYRLLKEPQLIVSSRGLGVRRCWFDWESVCEARTSRSANRRFLYFEIEDLDRLLVQRPKLLAYFDRSIG